MRHPASRFVCPLLFAALALAGPVHAESLSPLAAPLAEATSATAAPADVPAPPGTPDAWVTLQQALLALAEGRRDQARTLLERLQREHPDHPASRLSGPSLERMQARDPAGHVADPLPGWEERPTSWARAELVSFQTLAGLVYGAELCQALDCDSPRAFVGTLGVTTGLGLGLSLYASRDGITAGTALAANAGTLWGAWHGLVLVNGFGVGQTTQCFEPGQCFQTTDGRVMGATLVASQLGGLGLGLLAAHQWRPTAGQVAMVDTGGIWAGALTLLGFGIDRFQADEKTIFTTMMVTSDLGAVLGGLAAAAYPSSRGRMLVIDSGGLLGLLVGMGAAVLAQGDHVQQEPLFGMGLLGAATGLGTAVWLTRDWDAPDVNASLRVLPVPGGLGLALGGQF